MVGTTDTPSGRQLHHPAEERSRKVQAYYNCLNADAGFRASLTTLAAVLPGGRVTGPASADTLMRFCSRWHLPRLDGPTDVAQALSHDDGRHGLLTSAGWKQSAALIVPPAPAPFWYDPAEPGGRGRVRAYLDETFAAIRHAVAEQAEAIEDAARAKGFRERAPFYADKDRLNEAASIVYRRLVGGQPLKEIARDAGKKRNAIDALVEHWQAELDLA